MKMWLLIMGLSLTIPLYADTLTAEQAADSLKASRQSLREAREHYKTTVQAHGAHSPEAQAARQQLRQSRRAFHDQRRAVQTR